MKESSSKHKLDKTALITCLRAIRLAVREHRDQKGDYRCWVDDEVLYHRVLPELREVGPVLPTPQEFTRRCELFFNNRQDPAEERLEIPLDSSIGPLNLIYDSALDADLEQKSLPQLVDEKEQWYGLIEEHKRKGYEGRTYEDDRQLYHALPERTMAVTQLPPRDLFLNKNCPAYNEHCQRHPEQFKQGLWRNGPDSRKCQD